MRAHALRATQHKGSKRHQYRLAWGYSATGLRWAERAGAQDATHGSRPRWESLQKYAAPSAAATHLVFDALHNCGLAAWKIELQKGARQVTRAQQHTEAARHAPHRCVRTMSTRKQWMQNAS